MNQVTKRNGINKINTFFMVVVFMLLSTSSVFAQTASSNTNDSVTSIEKSEIANTNIEMNSMKQQSNSVDSNMNFILWFMGSNQNPNSNVIPTGSSAKKKTVYDFRHRAKSFVD